MAILVNDLYNINNEIVSLEFNQHTKLKLHYQPSSSSHTIKWKLIKTPFSIGNPMMEYVFQESGSAESQEQTEYLLLDIQGSYKIEIEEDTIESKYIYTLAIQVNGLKNKSSAPFPGETTEIDNVDGYMRKIEQATQRLTEESGSFSVIGVLDPNDENRLDLGETVVIKENEFIESIIPAGHTWELERANLTTQENALVGIVIERNTFERYDGDPSETFYRVGFLGQFNIPTSLPDPLESLGDSGGSFYYDPTSKSVEVDYSPTRFHWGRYITVEPTYDVSGYNVIVIESLMKLIPEGGLSSNFLTSFTLEFDRHDGDGDIKWEADTSSPNTTKYEISFFHGLQSNNLLVEVWKEPNEQSIYEEWVRVDIDEIIKEDENNMTLRITELDPNPDPTSDFKGRINIIKLDDSKEFKPGGLVWVGNILKTNWEEDSVEGDYFQKFKHNMNNFDLFVEIWDNNGVSKIRTVKDIIKENSNEIIIRVATSEDTFGGRLLLSTYLSGATKTFISLFDTPNSYVSAGQIPRVNSSLTGLEWADDVGLWKYGVTVVPYGTTDKTLIPKDSDVDWIGYLNESKFQGTEFYAKDSMVSDLFKGKRVEFISQSSAISGNDSVYLFDNGVVENEDDINAYSLKFIGKDGNAHSILTMRQKVEDLYVGPIDHKHWATTEAIKSYVDTMTPLNTFIGLTDTFQETPDSYGNNNLLVTKTDGVYEEPSLKFYYDGDTYGSTGKFLRIKDATLRLGNHDYDDDGDVTKDWLINLLNVKDDLAYHSGGGAKHQEKIFRHYSLMSSASSSRKTKFISQLRIEDIYANSTHPSKILGDLTWSLRTEGQIDVTSQFSEIKLISNIDRVEIEMRNSGSGNDSRNKISSLSSGAFLIEKYTASNTRQSSIEMSQHLDFRVTTGEICFRDVDTLRVYSNDTFNIIKRTGGNVAASTQTQLGLSEHSIITDGSRVHKIRRFQVALGGSSIHVLPDDDILILERSWSESLMTQISEILLVPDNRIHGRKITIINNIYNNVDDKSTAIVGGSPPNGPPHDDYLYPPIKISSINADSSGGQNICGHFNLFKWVPYTNDTLPTLVFLDALDNPALIRTNKASSFYLMNLSSVTLIWDDILDKWMIHNHHGFLGFYSYWTPQS